MKSSKKMLWKMLFIFKDNKIFEMFGTLVKKNNVTVVPEKYK